MSKRTHSEALQTKKCILAAAQKVFIKKGFEKASLSDIAREANVTRGAIYWHFENKNELLAELCRESVQDLNLVSPLMAAVDENQRDPLGCLKQWVLMHFTDDADILFNSAIFNIFDNVLSSSNNTSGVVSAREKLLELIQLRRFKIEEALRNAVRQMQLPPDIDIELAASCTQSLLLGFIETIRHGSAVKPYSRYYPTIDMFFSQLANMKKPQFTENTNFS